MFSRFFKSARKAQQRGAPAIPDGRRVYAIGDVHGRADLLGDLLARIERDEGERGDAQTTFVFLGDLVDRGPESAEVLDMVIAMREAGHDVHVIIGNHEEVFLGATRGGKGMMRFFLRIGGRETILSYGIDPQEYDALDHEDLAERLPALVPARHIELLEQGEDAVTIGDYHFVHAGIRPGRPLDAQKPSDLRWIRDDFLDHPDDHGKVIVHGHTICEEVEDMGNRIGIDTGAYMSGRLTAIGLEGARRWFIEASGDAHREAFVAGRRG